MERTRTPCECPQSSPVAISCLRYDSSPKAEPWWRSPPGPLHGCFLLCPGSQLDEVVLGILGHAQRRFEVEVCGFCFAPDHYLCAAPHK